MSRQQIISEFEESLDQLVTELGIPHGRLKSVIGQISDALEPWDDDGPDNIATLIGRIVPPHYR